MSSFLNIFMLLFLLISCDGVEKKGSVKSGDYLKDTLTVGSPEEFIFKVYTSVNSGKVSFETFKTYFSDNYLKRYSNILEEEYKELKDLKLDEEFSYTLEFTGTKYRATVSTPGLGTQHFIKKFGSVYKFAHKHLD